MRASSKLRIFMAAACLVGGTGQARAAFGPEQLKCRGAISAAGQKLADVAAKTLAGCHKRRSAGKLPATADCNDTAAADAKAKVRTTMSKLESVAVDQCSGLDPAELLYASCPVPCDGVAGTALASFADVGSCIACTVERAVRNAMHGTLGNPDPTALGTTAAKCHAAIGKAESKYLKLWLKENRKCQKLAEGAGGTGTDTCASAEPSAKVDKLRVKGEVAIEKLCDVPDVDLSDLDSCSDVRVDNLKACAYASVEAAALTIFESLYGLSATFDTTTTTNPDATTTTTTTGGSTTTTTTTGGFAYTCAVTFSVTTAHTIGALGYNVDYGPLVGEFVDSGNAVACQTALPPGAFASFFDNEADRLLVESIIASNGFTSPATLATCQFETNDPGIAGGGFGIEIFDASTPTFQPISPTIAVTNVACTAN